MEMLEVGKPKEADALPVVGHDVVGDDQFEENLDEEVLEVEEPKKGNVPPQVNLVEEVLKVESERPNEDVEVLENEKGGKALSDPDLDVEMLEVVRVAERRS